MISIVVPHLEERDLKPTFESIAKQTYWAIGKMNYGATTDNSKEGGARTRNLSLAFQRLQPWFEKVTHVFFCDDDVILYPTCIEKMKKALDDNPDCSIAYCNFLWGSAPHVAQAWNLKELKRGNYISNMSLIKIEDFPGYDESFKRFNDWDLWLTMAEQGCKGIWIDEILFKAECNNKGISDNDDYPVWANKLQEKHKL